MNRPFSFQNDISLEERQFRFRITLKDLPTTKQHN